MIAAARGRQRRLVRDRADLVSHMTRHDLRAGRRATDERL